MAQKRLPQTIMLTDQHREAEISQTVGCICRPKSPRSLTESVTTSSCEWYVGPTHHNIFHQQHPPISPRLLGPTSAASRKINYFPTFPKYPHFFLSVFHSPPTPLSLSLSPPLLCSVQSHTRHTSQRSSRRRRSPEGRHGGTARIRRGPW